MPDKRTPAVVYGAKSTTDEHGSIPTQHKQGRELAEHAGLDVGDRLYKDEAASAFKGNRGPGLAAAMAEAERLAGRGECALIVQHSDRLARGDGNRSRHLVELVLWARKVGVRLKSVQDPQTFDGMGLVYAALMGDRNHEDSLRKSKSVKLGLERRRNRGKPVGPVPLGYKVVRQVVDDKVLTRRVIDPVTVKTVERIFELVEDGCSFGDVARTLNEKGIRTRPRKDHPQGTTWVARTVNKIVHNRAYAGFDGYPKIIEPERFDAIHESLKRLDPVQVAKRRAGRKPRSESFILRGIAHCQRCGAALYTRTERGRRVYVCRHRRDGTRLCRAPVIEAELIESHVLRHLDSFIGSVETWLAQRVEERNDERRDREAALERQRARLRDLDRQRERHLATYRELHAEGASTAYIALEEVERIDAERAEQQRRIADGEALVDEWSGPPDVDAALDYYNGLVDHVQGRIRQAEGAADLNRALGQVLSGLWTEIEEDRERLLVEFELAEPTGSVLPGGARILFDRRP